MPTFQRSSESLEHTEVIAKDFAAVLRSGDLVRLVGEMGAGKTTFVRLVAHELGVDASLVSSPTFVLMNNYPCVVNGEEGSIAHLDCYRFGDEDELDALGWDRVMGDGSIVLVEWPERIDSVLGEDVKACTVTISHVDEGSRGFVFEVPESWMDRASALALTAKDWAKCPVTGERVHPESASWPFSSERARMSDLHGWMNEKYTVSRPVDESDFE
ncbi:MAG: tRNA (adenosine(37)-N6)-threonylcarbamoyltransferase complex ATPase subunit type 1 TsaE [Phycisphaerales bacterium]|nr:tRNA (adenosine(37)-N6)-threonylcarbamoyltransferase complex ATPase subunit type 1 TsaE [Phycisphaerales bacterium]